MLFIYNDLHTESAYHIMPYAQFIGLEVGMQDNLLTYHLPYQEMLIGNTLLPALHGGLIGGFMESVAGLFLWQTIQLECLPKIINFSLDYLRPGKPEPLYAGCILTRQGMRIINIAVKTWQSDINKPIAIGRGHFLMPQYN